MQKLPARSCLRVLFALLILSPAAAFAYVGPGAGITMLGTLWGLILAIIFVVFGLLILPIKIMRNRMKKKQSDSVVDAHKERNQAEPETSIEQRANSASD